MEIRKLIKLSRREKPKSCLLLCYIRRENISATYIILGQNTLVWKDCDMSHCSLCGVPLLNEGNGILLVLSSHSDCSSFLDYPRWQRMPKLLGERALYWKCLLLALQIYLNLTPQMFWIPKPWVWLQCRL